MPTPSWKRRQRHTQPPEVGFRFGLQRVAARSILIGMVIAQSRVRAHRGRLASGVEPTDSQPVCDELGSSGAVVVGADFGQDVGEVFGERGGESELIV
jgi:hypothetical protein